MRYELYIDVLFFVNFTMNLILLRLLAGIAKRRAGWGRLLAGAAAGAAGACAAVCRGWYMAGFLALPAVMVRIAFRPGDIREFLKETLCFLFAAVFLGGAMEFLYEHTRFGVFLELALRQDAPGLRLLGWGFLREAAYFFSVHCGRRRRKPGRSGRPSVR